MKSISIATIFSAVLFCAACNTDPQYDSNADTTHNPNADSVKPVNPNQPKPEMNSHLNFVDSTGKRQGNWIIYGKMANDPAFSATSKVEEGKYVDGKKEAEWIEYNPGGGVKKKVNFHEGQEVK